VVAGCGQYAIYCIVSKQSLELVGVLKLSSTPITWVGGQPPCNSSPMSKP
jgi:hypothetical protein